MSMSDEHIGATCDGECGLSFSGSPVPLLTYFMRWTCQASSSLARCDCRSRAGRVCCEVSQRNIIFLHYWQLHSDHLTRHIQHTLTSPTLKVVRYQCLVPGNWPSSILQTLSPPGWLSGFPLYLSGRSWWRQTIPDSLHPGDSDVPCHQYIVVSWS